MHCYELLASSNSSFKIHPELHPESLHIELLAYSVTRTKMLGEVHFTLIFLPASHGTLNIPAAKLEMTAFFKTMDSLTGHLLVNPQKDEKLFLQAFIN